MSVKDSKKKISSTIKHAAFSEADLSNVLIFKGSITKKNFNQIGRKSIFNPKIIDLGRQLEPAIDIYLNKLTGLFTKEEEVTVFKYFMNFKFLTSLNDFKNKFMLLSKIICVNEYSKDDIIYKAGIFLISNIYYSK